MMKTRKINKTIAGLLAVCAALLVSSMIMIPSKAETETRDLVVWGDAANPNNYDKDSTDPSQQHPTLENYLFAGWYANEGDEEALTDLTGVDSAVPKFVDEDVLSVYFQVAPKNAPGDYCSADSTITAQVEIRILTSVDSLQYEKVSFLIGSNKAEYETKTVYKKVTDSQGNEYDSTDVCSTNTNGYLMAAYVKALDSTEDANGDNTFEKYIKVTPTWTTMDGTVVEGKPMSKRVVDDPTKMSKCEATFKTYDADGSLKEILWIDTLEEAAHRVVTSENAHVTIDVKIDNAKLPSHDAYTKTENYTYTLNGNDKTLDASGCGNSSLFKCQSANKTFVLKNATINHGTTGTSKIFTTNKSFTLQMYDVKINSTAVGAGEQALFAATSTSYDTQIALDITMDNVHVTWNPGKTQRGFFDFQYDVNANMQVTNSSFKAEGEGSVITNTVYWRYYKSYTLNLTVDDVSKPYFDGLVKHSKGAVTLNMSDYVEEGENETPSVPIS